MIWLNACPRCWKGTVYLDEDDTRHCVHCGFVQYRPPSPDFARETTAASNAYRFEDRRPAAASKG